jgi:hypothetical protein
MWKRWWQESQQGRRGPSPGIFGHWCWGSGALAASQSPCWETVQSPSSFHAPPPVIQRRADFFYYMATRLEPWGRIISLGQEECPFLVYLCVLSLEWDKRLWNWPDIYVHFKAGLWYECFLHELRPHSHLLSWKVSVGAEIGKSHQIPCLLLLITLSLLNNFWALRRFKKYSPIKFWEHSKDR